MKRGISRKVNMSRYNGGQYESVDFWIEDEEKSFKDLREELQAEIEDYICNVPIEQAKFNKAKDAQLPFVEESDIQEETS